MCSESRGMAPWGSWDSFCCLPEDTEFLMRHFVQQSHSATQNSTTSCTAGKPTFSAESALTGRQKSKGPASHLPALLRQGLTLINVYEVIGDPWKERDCAEPESIVAAAWITCFSKEVVIRKCLLWSWPFHRPIRANPVIVLHDRFVFPLVL